MTVIDGMGGMGFGDIAAETIATRLEFFFQRLEIINPQADVIESLINANDYLRVVIEKNPVYEGMGAVVTACLVKGEKACVAQIGDSRLYLFRDNVLKQITKDQNFVAELLESGLITRAEALVHPNKNQVTQAIGPQDQITPVNTEFTVKQRDRLLLCSDGLYGMVSDESIGQILKEKSNMEECAKELLEIANESGGGDNITVVVADLS